MMLKAAPTARLSASLLGSAVAVLPCLWILTTFSGLFRLAGLLMLLAVIHGLVLAYKLMDRTVPLMVATKDGLELDPLISDNGLLPWDQVKALRHISFKGSSDPFGWLDYVLLRSTQPGTFTGMAKWLPITWLGIYLLPTRLLEGGAEAGASFVAEVETARRDQHFATAIAQAGAAPVAPAPLPVPMAMAEVVSHDILTALQNRAQSAQKAEGQARLPFPSGQPAVRAAQAPLLPGAVPGKPQVAARQDLGKMPVHPTSGYKGVMLNGKPLEF